jgi:hypothetical protein
VVRFSGRTRRQLLAASAAVAALAGLTACTSSGSSSSAGPAQSASTAAASSPATGSSSSGQSQNSARFLTAAPLLTQCAISHGVQAVRSSAEKYNASQPKDQQWLSGTAVEMKAANGSAFTDWLDNGGGGTITLGGQQLSNWPMWAANHDALPTQVCGTAVSGAAVRQLYTKVYAHWPSMLASNPW